MALEVVKTSAYQANTASAASTYDAGGFKSADVNYDSLRNLTSANYQQTADKEEKELSATERHIKSEISKANQRLKSNNIRCEFGYHVETKRVTIKVYDKETEEIIREIPPEKTLEMIEKIWELAGLLVDEKR